MTYPQFEAFLREVYRQCGLARDRRGRRIGYVKRALRRSWPVADPVAAGLKPAGLSEQPR